MCDWDDSIRPVVCPDCLEDGNLYPLQEAVKMRDMPSLYCEKEVWGTCPHCLTTFPIRYRIDQNYDDDDYDEWTYIIPN